MIKTSQNHVDDNLYGNSFWTHVEFDYKANGDVKSRTNMINNLTAEFSYDIYGNLQQSRSYSLTNPDLYEKVQRMGYDNFSHRFIALDTNSLGQIKQFKYNNEFGKVKEEIEYNGFSTLTNYDDFGIKTEEIDEYGNKILFVYDWNDQNETINIKGTDKDYAFTLNKKSFLANETIAEALITKSYYTSNNMTLREVQEIFKSDYSLPKLVTIDKVYYMNWQLRYESEPYLSTESPDFWTEYDYEPLSGKVNSISKANGNTQNTLYKSINYDLENLISTENNLQQDGVPTGSLVKEYNVHGDLKKSTDEAGNAVTYNYWNSGLLKNVTTVVLNQSGAHSIQLNYDNIGRRTQMVDPNIGTLNYVYNDHGDIIEESNPNGTIKTYYDDYGRKDSVEYYLPNSATPYNTVYHLYVPIDENDGIYGDGKLDSLYETQSNLQKKYVYDNYWRVLSEKQNIDTEAFILENVFDKSIGKLKRTIFNQKDTITYAYDKKGFMVSKIFNGTNKDTTLWTLKEINRFGHETLASIADVIDLSSTYDIYGLLTGIKYANSSNQLQYQNHEYLFDPARQTLAYRKDLLADLHESFTFGSQGDKSFLLKRLTGWNISDLSGNSCGNFEMNYNDDGTIRSKGRVGFESNYVYSETTNDVEPLDATPTTQFPQAIKKLSSSYENLFPYTMTNTIFNSVKTIEMCDRNAVFDYGFDLQRCKYTYFKNGVKQYTKYYFHNIEKTVFENGDIKNTVIGNNFAIITENQDRNIYYLLKDHLGSVTKILNSDFSIVGDFNYDPWGRMREKDNNFETLSVYDVPSGFELIGRGFTGHEHILEFGLINMNGRVYDPALGQFIQPDNFVTIPERSNSYNRFIYANNNPLSFVDSDGEFVTLTTILITAAIFGAGNVAAQAIRLDGKINIGQIFSSFVQGAIVGGAVACGYYGLYYLSPTLAYITAGVAYGPQALTYGVGTLFGLTKGLYTGDYTNFWNAQKILLGNFYIDENQSYGMGILQGMSAHSLELLQNSIGSALQQYFNFNAAVDRVDYFDGATFTTNENSNGGGISLGKFIHCWYDGEIEGGFKAFVLSSPKYMHEYGHYLDSKRYLTGYLFAIAIPSLWSAATHKGEKSSAPFGFLSWHRTFWTELRANRKASDYFAREHGITFDDTEFPLYTTE